MIDPVCAFHGKRWSEHEGGRCLFCCICFKTLKPEQCVLDLEGQRWDACPGRCAYDAGIPQWTWIYYWKNNERRAELKGKTCFVIAAATRMSSVLIEFLDGTRVVTSERAIRRVLP